MHMNPVMDVGDIVKLDLAQGADRRYPQYVGMTGVVTFHAEEEGYHSYDVVWFSKEAFEKIEHNMDIDDLVVVE